MTQPEDAVPRRIRMRAVLAVGALLVLVVLGYAGWRHQHPPYYVGATFEHVTVEAFEIACPMSGTTMSWHRITLGGDRFDLVDWDSFPPGKAVQGTLRTESSGVVGFDRV
jgi:hypothetical protein